ncbi:LLM class flavin-dependent oxidoreductase [Polymorphospora sp. NPDC050346]|uniref:LLM class flavin-dependent oxidoreductase n=1 Tax=Polymorphospora sp. NPDC050346 TaxID=3155780 RepID=UPI0033D12ACC
MAARRLRTGIAIEGSDLPVRELIDRARLAEQVGLDAAWLIQLPNMRDSFSVLAAMAAVTERIQLGAGIMPLYTRPPVVMAQTAATIDEVSDGRFTLGVGLGHRLTAEWSLGVPLGPSLPAMREYLSVVTALLRTGEVHVDGKWYKGHSRYASPRRDGLATCLGALGPKMSELAGEVADGLLLWMCTVDYVRDVAIPHLRKGLERSGRDLDGFPVVVFAPGAVSVDRAGDVESLRHYLSTYARVPNYRAMYEASGFAHALAGGEIGDDLLSAVGVIGSDDDVTARVAEYAAAGATEVVITPMASAHQDRDLWRRTGEAAVRAAGGR